VSELADESRQRAAVQGAAKKATQEVSIVIPVMNETFSLEQTVEILLADNRDDMAEIVLVISPRTTPESRAVIARLIEENPTLIWVHTQTLPHLGGALQEAFALTCGNYTLLMASDLETDPHLVRDLIRTARESGADIVTASRWIRGGGFHGYHPLKLAFNYAFQHLIGALYLTRLSDMTYGFRIFKTEVLRNVRWEEMKHPFLLETMLKPLRMGRTVKEIPVQWEPRQEGESQIRFATYYGYMRIAAKVRVRRRSRLSNGAAA
jgi:glycosyltransferase involved in cell wall biosynthesis